MLLYVDAKSKNGFGYTPDWIQITYNEDGKRLKLTLDIRGGIDYDTTCLSCRCKGSLVPWTVIDCGTGTETDLSKLSEAEIESGYSNKKISEIFENGFNFLVGAYPVDEENYWEPDMLTEGHGSVELYITEENRVYIKEFDFDVEITEG